jgi:MarR family transcriptional regulator, transcriptional regulator for hemolysin
MPPDLDDDLLILLSDTARHVRTYADRSMQAHGRTRAQLAILARLERHPNLSQKELAAIAELSPVTILRSIDRLEALGLVQRRVDPVDRRIWRLRVTPEAGPPLSTITDSLARLHNIATIGIEPTVLETMAHGLRCIKENVSTRRSNTVDRKNSPSIRLTTNCSAAEPNRSSS